MDVHGVLCVMLVASLGPAWGSVLVEVPSNDVKLTCPYEAIPNTQFNVPYIMLTAQYECYKPTATFLTQVNYASNTDEFRHIFQRACVQAPEVRKCIANVGREAEVCLSAMEKKMFATVRHFVEAGIGATCDDESDAVARLYGDELKQLDLSGQLRVFSCISATALKTEYRKEADLPAYTVRRYTAIKDAKQCIANVARNKGKSAPNFEKFFQHMLSVMQCISPRTEAVVLCSSLEEQDSHSSESVEN